MSELTEEFPSDTSNDFGFSAIGGSIQLVADFNEKLPYKRLNNLAYAPHSGLFAAIGPTSLVIGTLKDLRSDIDEGKAQYETGAHTLEIAGANSIYFSSDELNLIYSLKNELKFVPINTSDYHNITASSFESLSLPVEIDAICPCPSNGNLVAVLSLDKSLSFVKLSEKSVTKISEGVLDFSWSPKGKQIAVSKDDRSIKQLRLDGTEAANFTVPEDIDGLPLSLTWLSTKLFFVLIGDELTPDPESEPDYNDFKAFLIEHDSKQGSTHFRETFDAIPTFSSVWRKPQVYSVLLNNLSESLPSLTILASALSVEISALTPETQLEPLNDFNRAAYPMREDDQSDVFSTGLIYDTRLGGEVIEPCAGISRAEWLPTIWALGDDGRIQSWNIFHIHDLKQKNFVPDRIRSYEDDLWEHAKAGSSAVATLAQETSTGKEAKTSPTDEYESSAPKTTSTSAFGSTASGSTAPVSTTPAFGSTSLGSTAPAFGSTSLGSNAPAFGSTSFGSTAPAFGSASFGTKAPAFGSSAFGGAASTSSTISNKPENKPLTFGSTSFGSTGNTAFGSPNNTFGSSGFGAKPSTAAPSFGSSSFGSSSNASPFSTVAPNATSGFASFASKKGSVFGTSRGEDTKVDNPFGGPSAVSKGNESPFALFNKTTSASPFGSAVPKTDSPFGNLAKADSTSSPFSGIGSSPSSSLFGSQQDKKEKSLQFDSFLDGVTKKKDDILREDGGEEDEDEDDNDDDENEDSEEEDSDQSSSNVEQSHSQSDSTPSLTTSGPTSFPTGPTSFGNPLSSSSASGFGSSNVFGSTAFGSTGFGKPALQSTSGSSGLGANTSQSFSVGSSGFGAFAEKKVAFGGKDIFSTEDSKVENKESPSTQVADQDESEIESEIDNETFNGFDESSLSDTSKGENVQDDEEEEQEDDSKDLSENSAIQSNDQDQTRDDQSFDQSFESSVADDSHIGDSSEIDNDDNEKLDSELHDGTSGEFDVGNDDIGDEDLDNDDSSVSLKLTSEDELYEQAKNQDKVENQKSVIVMDDNSSSSPLSTGKSDQQVEHADKGVQHQKAPHKEISTQYDYVHIDNAAIQTEEIKCTSIAIEAFEDDEVYAGEFTIPRSVPPYVSSKGVNYPQLSADPTLKELEKIIYDTEAELSVVEENAKNIGLFLEDHMNPERKRSEKSLGHPYQWRLEESKLLKEIVEGKLPAAAQLRSELSEKLQSTVQLKEKLQALEKQSKGIKENILAAEKVNDPVILKNRDLSFESLLLQKNVREHHGDVLEKLREAEQSLLSLKARANLFVAEAPNSDSVHSLISHISNLTRDYSSETKTLTSEISKMNLNHEKILHKLYDNKQKDFDEHEWENRSVAQLRVTDISKRLSAQRSIAKALRERKVSEVTSVL